MAVNLRNKPIDRRRLDRQSRQSYRPANRIQAHRRAKQYAGMMAQANNMEQFRTEKKPGTGGFTQGLALQQERMRNIGRENRRAKQLRS